VSNEAELTHANILDQIRGLHSLGRRPDGGRALSYLPFAHMGDRAIRRANDDLNAAEQIRRFTVAGETWLPGGDELTPTMKLKRKPIAVKHAALIDALYGGEESDAVHRP
jgi:long-subunit acyl-CoA synthetase (AMP-forming)